MPGRHIISERRFVKSRYSTMKNMSRIIAVVVLMLSAVAVSAQRPKLVRQNPHDRYEVRSGKVYYGNMVLPEAYKANETSVFLMSWSLFWLPIPVCI